MKLYGSQTSPYVRRLRLLMENIDYEFISLDVYEGEGRKTIQKVSPLAKIPVLENPPETIFDSRQIFEYLCESSVHPKLDWDRKNVLTIIDGINEAFVNFALLRRSNIEVPKDSLYGMINWDRIDNGMKELDHMIAKGEFDQWDYASMSLYCLIEWVEFRKLKDLSEYKNLKVFMDKFKDDPIVKETKPV